MTASDIRINARLTGEDAARFQELPRRSGHSASELLRDALREYHAARQRPRRNPLELLAGYIATGEGPEDLSTRYKEYLATVFQEKFPIHVQHEP